MSPALLKLLSLLGSGTMVAGPLGMLVDESNKEKTKHYGSYQEYLEDEDVPLEERVKRAEDIQKNRYISSPAHRDYEDKRMERAEKIEQMKKEDMAKLQALKKLRAE